MSFKVFTALSAIYGWYLYHIDIVATFLVAKLQESIYIELPELFRDGYPGKISQLVRSLYGLKQAPREWYNRLHDVLLSLGF